MTTSERKPATCDCHRCESEIVDPIGTRWMNRRMILCPDCGNKRCPKATDHSLACTKSNEPGQKGSVYE